MHSFYQRVVFILGSFPLLGIQSIQAFIVLLICGVLKKFNLKFSYKYIFASYALFSIYLWYADVMYLQRITNARQQRSQGGCNVTVAPPKPKPLSTRYNRIFKLFIHKCNIKRIFKVKMQIFTPPPKTNFWLRHGCQGCLCTVQAVQSVGFH